MIQSIDHVVILVKDLEAAIADYAALGFTVVPGGEHTGGATHNALVAFQDGSYLELIAFKREAPEHQWWRYAASGEGIIDFALLPDAIDADVAAAASHGLRMEPPADGGRLRPDGQRIAWKTSRPPSRDLPFLCADVTPRNLRVPDQETWQHANGVTGIADLIVVVTDVQASTSRYAALLSRWPAASADDRASFALGDGTITVAAAEEAPLRERLEARGEGPFGLRLRAAEDAPAGVLDPALAHGAWLEVVQG